MTLWELNGTGGELSPGIVGGLLHYWREDKGRLWYRCYWSIGSGLFSEASVAEATGASIIRIVLALGAAAVCASELSATESVSL